MLRGPLLRWQRRRPMSHQLLRQPVLGGLPGSRVRQLLHVRLPLRCTVQTPLMLLQLLQMLLALLLCLQLSLLQVLVAGLSPVGTLWTRHCRVPKVGAAGGPRRQAAKAARAVCCSIGFLSCRPQGQGSTRSRRTCHNT